MGARNAVSRGSSLAVVVVFVDVVVGSKTVESLAVAGWRCHCWGQLRNVRRNGFGDNSQIVDYRCFFSRLSIFDKSPFDIMLSFFFYCLGFPCGGPSGGFFRYHDAD
jgi:hypothetical protein